MLFAPPLGLMVTAVLSALLLGLVVVAVVVVIFPASVLGSAFSSTVVQAHGVLQLMSGRAWLMLRQWNNDWGNRGFGWHYMGPLIVPVVALMPAGCLLESATRPAPCCPVHLEWEAKETGGGAAMYRGQDGEAMWGCLAADELANAAGWRPGLIDSDASELGGVSGALLSFRLELSDGVCAEG
jgi:hypothetical protein